MVTLVWWWLQIMCWAKQTARLTTTTTAITSNSDRDTINIKRCLPRRASSRPWTSTNNTKPSSRVPTPSRISSNSGCSGSITDSTATGVLCAVELYRTSAPCELIWTITTPETPPPVRYPAVPKPSPTLTVYAIT